MEKEEEELNGSDFLDYAAYFTVVICVSMVGFIVAVEAIVGIGHFLHVYCEPIGVSMYNKCDLIEIHPGYIVAAVVFACFIIFCFGAGLWYIGKAIGLIG